VARHKTPTARARRAADTRVDDAQGFFADPDATGAAADALAEGAALADVEGAALAEGAGSAETVAAAGAGAVGATAGGAGLATSAVAEEIGPMFFIIAACRSDALNGFAMSAGFSPSIASARPRFSVSNIVNVMKIVRKSTELPMMIEWNLWSNHRCMKMRATVAAFTVAITMAMIRFHAPKFT
jgi:hypothetical protein